MPEICRKHQNDGWDCSPDLQQTKKFDKDPNQTKIDALRKQVENLPFDDEKTAKASSEAGGASVL